MRLRLGKRRTRAEDRPQEPPRPAAAPDLERQATEIGRELLAAAREHRSGLFSARFWSDQLMGWAMKDPAFKVQLLRFIDVFPMLHTPQQVHEYLLDYLSQPGVTLPPGMDLGLKAGGLAKGVLAKTVAGRITAIARNFIAGSDVAAALPVLETLWKKGVATSVDLLGEACVSHQEAEAYQRRYLDLIGLLGHAVGRWPGQSLLENDHLGPLPRGSVSIKLTALSPRADPIHLASSLDDLSDALRPILESAARQQVLVTFDMEQHELKELTLALFERCCERYDFPAGMAMQAYLRSGMSDAERIIGWARRSGRQVTVRLIKGAYWDYEVAHAERMGWPVPVWTEKRRTDACFEQMAEQFVAAMPRRAGEGGVKLAVGSHNARSIAYTLALLEKHDLPPSAVEVQNLYGMAEPLQAALSRREVRLRLYVPLGEMIPGMAYLVRRLLENTSNQSWLRAGFFEDVPEELLLASPHASPLRAPTEGWSGEGPGVRAAAAPARPHPNPLPEGEGTGVTAAAGTAAKPPSLSPAVDGLGDGLPMTNEPLRDFAQAAVREAFSQAIDAVKVPVVRDASDADQARQMMAAAAAAFPGWRDFDPLKRSRLILRAAGLMRNRRDELAAIMIREAGKPWREADAEVCEAVDFCEYYARVAVGLFRPQQLGQFAAEWNQQWYQARGVAAIISPWNFPLSICCGMTTAALAVGNTAVVKPSTQTRGIAQAMCEIFWQAGIPADVLRFLPGAGRAIGDLLVRDPRVALIAFTGSKEVGLGILRAAGDTPEGQPFVKKVVCEMGGKNAIIVDDSTDLDEAVLGVRQSAFGYCGQKCSACSRAIVLDGVHDQFLKRLVESTRSLVIGDPADPNTDLGPVIDENAARKIRQYVEIGKGEGRLELACEVPDGLAARVGKPYVGPHIFSGIRQEHRLANEEIFGPVLAVMRVASFAEALEVANSTAYKLTGGVYSRKPSHLEAARREFRVGNLYLNRGITGALVGRQPFGGFGLSGVGSKAGGPDYLLHFVEPRSCSENTMRRGFTPATE